MAGRRALILGGGGPVGIAWEAGLLAGLAGADVDVSDADAIFGTSAGSVVGALLSLGRTPADLAAAYSEAPAEVPEARRRATSGAAAPDVAFLFGVMQEAMRGARPGAELAAELGAHALAAATVDEPVFLQLFDAIAEASRATPWPERFACTAFDAGDGRFQVWDAGAGVELARAVASSCAVPGVYPPITLGGRRYIDGGVLSPTNAQLARGSRSALVVSVTEVFLGGVARALGTATALEREVEALRAEGTRVEVLQLGAEGARAFGANLMDVRFQPQALEAGLAQGRAEAERVRALWTAAEG